MIATLTVAVSVAVRGLADPQSDSSQGIDEARRQFLRRPPACSGASASRSHCWLSSGISIPMPSGFLRRWDYSIIAAATSAIAADSMTVLGRAKSATPAFASWVREQEVERIQRGAERARQEMYKVGRRDRLAVVGKAAMVLIPAGVLLGARTFGCVPGLSDPQLLEHSGPPVALGPRRPVRRRRCAGLRIPNDSPLATSGMVVGQSLDHDDRPVRTLPSSQPPSA